MMPFILSYLNNTNHGINDEITSRTYTKGAVDLTDDRGQWRACIWTHRCQIAGVRFMMMNHKAKWRKDRQAAHTF